MSDYIGADTILVPMYDLNFCEKCGATYGNCEHHPMEAKRIIMTKAELKELYKPSKWHNLTEVAPSVGEESK